jgi:hypothetical protein
MIACGSSYRPFQVSYILIFCSIFSYPIFSQSPYNFIRISCRCGRIIVQMARDHDQTRPHIRKALLAQIEVLCNEAVQVHQSLPLYHEPTLESPRIQILQRLTNLCVVLEGMGSEGRRQTNEFMKEILNEETIENLVKAFACTLPASRQLLAQLR